MTRLDIFLHNFWRGSLVGLIVGILIGLLVFGVLHVGGASGGQTISIPAGMYCDTSGVCLSVGGVVPTATLSPTTTASVTPVSTISPSSTPSATLTPEPPTPTQETFYCTGKVNTAVLNIRSGPGTSYSVIGQAVIGQPLALEGRTGEWYKIYDGWVYGVYITLDDPDCTPPVIPAQIAGLHLLFSARAAPVLDALRRGAIGSLKGTDGSEAIMRAAQQTSPDVLLIWRNLGRVVYGTRDCPANWGQGDPVEVATQWWSAEYATWQQRGLIGVVDWFEYRNECLFVGAWEIAFDLRMVELASNAGVCLALFSDGFGNPEVWEFAQRAPVLDYVLAHPCQPGRYHAIAHHIYHGVDGGTWLFWRWRLFLQALGDPKYLKLVWLITEYGVDEGRGPVDCTRFLADMRQAVRYLAGSQVWSLAAYSVGGGTEWTDLDPCLPQLTK